MKVVYLEIEMKLVINQLLTLTAAAHLVLNQLLTLTAAAHLMWEDTVERESTGTKEMGQC